MARTRASDAVGGEHGRAWLVLVLGLGLGLGSGLGLGLGLGLEASMAAPLRQWRCSALPLWCGRRT